MATYRWRIQPDRPWRDVPMWRVLAPRRLTRAGFQSVDAAREWAFGQALAMGEDLEPGDRLEVWLDRDRSLDPESEIVWQFTAPGDSHGGAGGV